MKDKSKLFIYFKNGINSLILYIFLISSMMLSKYLYVNYEENLNIFNAYYADAIVVIMVILASTLINVFIFAYIDKKMSIDFTFKQTFIACMLSILTFIFFI